MFVCEGASESNVSLRECESAVSIYMCLHMHMLISTCLCMRVCLWLRVCSLAYTDMCVCLYADAHGSVCVPARVFGHPESKQRDA